MACSGEYGNLILINELKNMIFILARDKKSQCLHHWLSKRWLAIIIFKLLNSN